MTDQPPADTGATPEGPPQGTPMGPQMRVLVQYVRDLSFENPRAPETLRAQNAVQPQIEMGVEMNARGREDGLFEVDLKLSAHAAREDGPVFHVELLYGAVFQITGVPQEELEPVLLVECPRFMFPFARQIIAGVTSDGGYPPFMLDPIDFAGVYAARRAQAMGGEPIGHA